MNEGILHVRPRNAETFRLVHLSDPHLTTLTGVAVGELLNKRMLGYLSWLFRRRHEHQAGVLQRILDDVRETQADHVAITGDLTHVGTPAECAQAAHWLQTLGDPDAITLVPGNHDFYVRTPFADTIGPWRAYMAGDSGAHPADGEKLFPSLRTRGRLAIIGLNTGLPTAPFMATGALDGEQLERLDPMLTAARQAGLFRGILIHHPPAHGQASARRRLRNAAALQAVLNRSGAELILHGHTHRFVCSRLQTRTGGIPVFGVPSASAMTTHAARRAGYNVYEIGLTQGGWKVIARQRQLAASGKQISQINEIHESMPIASR